MEDEKKITPPWVIIGTVLAIIVGVYVGSHFFLGCSSLFDACIIGKK